ncbi:MAG: 3-isopropylmalate dehydratase small subunit, partial [uncultured Quadrisphaera sp.]
GALLHPHRGRRAAAAQQRRHRPDHPRRLPQARGAHGLRGRAVRGLAVRPELRAQPGAVPRRLGAGRRARLRHRLLARARGVGAEGLRLPRGAQLPVRRHLPRQLRQAGARRRAAGARGRRAAVEAPRADPRRRGDRRPRGAHGGLRVVQRPVRRRRLHPLAPDGGPRRRRHDAALGRRDRRLRGGAPVVQADDPASAEL